MTATNRISRCFAEKAVNNEKILITYFMAGDPSLAGSEAIIDAAIKSGADIIELGLPFTDPLADGPVIEQAGLRSLTKGINVEHVLKLAENIRQNQETPLVIMSYYNPIYKYGLANFVKKACEVGIDGLIIPDLPFGEDEELYQECKKRDIQLIPLVVASTDTERLGAIAAREPAFIYCVSVNGITGVRQTVENNVQDFLHQVRNITNRPLGVGFGIGTGDQAKMMADNCDAVIVGSALVRLVADNFPQENVMIDKIANKVAELKQAIS